MCSSRAVFKTGGSIAAMGADVSSFFVFDLSFSFLWDSDATAPTAAAPADDTAATIDFLRNLLYLKKSNIF